MRLIVDPIWSWPIVVTAAAALLAVVLMTYRQRIAHLPPAYRRTLLGLRLLSWAMLVFLLFRPELEFSRSDRKSSIFAIVTDRSRSMNVKDGPAGASRRATLLKTLADVAADLEALQAEAEIRQYEFDQELAAVETRPPESPGEQTAIGHVLEELRKLAQGARDKRLAGILLLTDGAQRALVPFDTEPRIAARGLADLPVPTPVHTVGFGTSGLAETSLDLAMEDLEVNPTVFVKNTVVVGARLRALGAADRPLTVRLLIEDPGANKPGEPPAMKLAAPPLKLTTSQSQDLLPVEVNFVANQPGEFKLTVQVDPLDGEPLITNNSLSTFITVLKGGVNVAYFDKIRPEQKYIRRIDESPDIQLDFKPVRAGTLGEATPIDEQWFEPGKYDVYIIGDVPARVFGPVVLRKLARAVELGAGLMMTGGFHSFGPGGYGGTPLADLLPVTMQAAELRAADDVDASQQFVEPLQMLPTSAGLQDFVMRLESSSEKNEARWKSLAPLEGANRFSGLKPLALVLAETADKVPLLARQEVGRARSLAFAGDTTYRWFLAGQQEAHQQFWQQVVLWLAHKELQGDNSIWLKLNARRFRAGQPVEITVGARDTGKQPISDALFKIEVTDPKGQKHTVPSQHLATEDIASFSDNTLPGEYRVNVEASRQGKSLGLGPQARFMVYEQDLELHNPTADIALLEELSRMTDGQYVPPEKLGEFLRSLKGKLSAEVVHIRKVKLWDNTPVLLAFALIMSLEWYLRKRRGMV